MLYHLGRAQVPSSESPFGKSWGGQSPAIGMSEAMEHEADHSQGDHRFRDLLQRLVILGQPPPSPAPRPACWACSPSPLCSAAGSAPRPSALSRPRPGIARRNQPSPIPSPPCVRKSGPLKVFPCRAPDQTAENSRAACARASLTPFATPHDPGTKWPKSKLVEVLKEGH